MLEGQAEMGMANTAVLNPDLLITGTFDCTPKRIDDIPAVRKTLWMELVSVDLLIT